MFKRFFVFFADFRHLQSLLLLDYGIIIFDKKKNDNSFKSFMKK